MCRTIPADRLALKASAGLILPLAEASPEPEEEVEVGSGFVRLADKPGLPVPVPVSAMESLSPFFEEEVCALIPASMARLRAALSDREGVSSDTVDERFRCGNRGLCNTAASCCCCWSATTRICAA